MRLVLCFLLSAAGWWAQGSAKGLPDDCGEAIQLFDGETLDGFRTWLRTSGTNDPQKVFSVTNGQIRISGRQYGYLATERSYSNYWLAVEYRWGPMANVPERRGNARDSGVFLHATGPDGNSHDGDGAFKAAIECNVFEGATGDILLIRGTDSSGHLIRPQVRVEVAKEKDSEGWYTWLPGGRAETLERWGRVNWRGKSMDWEDRLAFRGPRDPEQPVGEWNRLDIRCAGSSVEIWLNGRLVNSAFEVWPAAGEILLQSEGSEIFFRKVEVRPLRNG